MQCQKLILNTDNNSWRTNLPHIIIIITTNNTRLISSNPITATMCYAYVPPPTSTPCPPKKRSVQPKPTAPDSGRSRKLFHHLSLHECVGTHRPTSSTPNPSIEASGNMLHDKEDGIICFAFQNVNGISLHDNLHLMPDAQGCNHWCSPA